jgi:hypothetical protein
MTIAMAKEKTLIPLPLLLSSKACKGLQSLGFERFFVILFS